MGHVMRTLAIAQHWKRTRGDVHFLMSESTDYFSQILDKNDLDWKKIHSSRGTEQDLDETVGVIEGNPVSAVVLDGYQFDRNYQARLRKMDPYCLLIDDLGDNDYYCPNGILNQNLYAEHSLYDGKTPGDTDFFLGADFVLLREEFFQQERPTPLEVSPPTILLTLGGSERRNAILFVLESLVSLTNGFDFSVEIVVNSSNSSLNEIYNVMENFEGTVHVNPDNVPEIMANASLAITGGGTTVWELIYFGVPVLCTILATNQVFVAEYIEKQDLGKNLGKFEMIDCYRIRSIVSDLLENTQRLISISNRSKRLIDGKGPQRICEKLAKN